MQWQPIDFLGVAGGVMLLFAFWRTSAGVWKTTSPWYELDNFIASGLLLWYSWHKHAYVNIVLNVIWGFVAFRGLTSFSERRLKRDKHYRKAFRRAQTARRRMFKS